MKNKRVQKTLVAIVLFLAVWASLIPMLMPELFNYEYSLKHLKAKEEKITELSTKVLKAKESILEESISQASIERAAKDAAVLKSLLAESEYTVALDIPSVLVFLEQEAKASNAIIEIDFAKIETYDIKNGNTGKEVNVNLDKTKEAVDGAKPPVVAGTPPIKEPVPGNTTTEEPEVGNSPTEEPAEKIWGSEVSLVENNKIRLLHSVFYEEIPPLVGATVTLIPIMVRGEYSDIGAFIERLDIVEYLEPGYLGTYSTGDEVISVIGLFVFHKEGDK